MDFETHKNNTANDCEQFAEMVVNLAKKIRAGDMKAFEKFWIEGGTEEGDAKIFDLRQRIILRYGYWEELMERSENKQNESEKK